MKRLTRILAGAIALGSFATAYPASADQGNSIVDSKQVGEGLVVLGGTTYRVSESTALEDENGQPISFTALPTVAQGASSDDAAVWFEASDTEVSTPILHRLKLTGAVPQ
jgi:hypothetical protein